MSGSRKPVRRDVGGGLGADDVLNGRNGRKTRGGNSSIELKFNIDFIQTVLSDILIS